MDIVGNVKEIADLAKKYNDIEFYRKIVQLEGEVIELTRRNRHADEQIDKLQRQLTLRTTMQFRQPFYFKDGDEVPFCPRCYEKDTAAVHLIHKGQLSNRTLAWGCPECKQNYTSRN